MLSKASRFSSNILGEVSSSYMFRNNSSRNIIDMVKTHSSALYCNYPPLKSLFASQKINEVPVKKTWDSLLLSAKVFRMHFPMRSNLDSDKDCCNCCEMIEEHLKYAEKVYNQRPNRKRNRLPRYCILPTFIFKSNIGFIDSHCHLDFLFNRTKFVGTFAEYQMKHKVTFPHSYRGCIAVFCKPSTFYKIPFWQKYLDQENVWGAFGCHPHNAAAYNDYIEESLKIALTYPKVRALGEIGLDYSNRNKCPKEIQHKVFRRQLKIAYDTGLRVVIHCRDANKDCINILREFLPKDYIFHLHCFTDSWHWAQKWLKTFPNVYIGITNLVTYKSAKLTHEVAKKIPLNHLLLETDAPYFVPRKVSKRVRWSHPGMAIHVAAQIAALRNITLEEVIYWTHKNTIIMLFRNIRCLFFLYLRVCWHSIMSFENCDEPNNQKKELAVLRSKENEQFTSSSLTWKTESPCSERNIPKSIHSTPLLRKGNELPSKSNSISSLKRSHAVCERDDLQDEISFTPRTSINKIQQRIKRFNLASPENMRMTSSFLRKSLPSKLESRFNSSYEDISNNGSSQRRKSFPCTKSPYHSSSSHSFHRCATDQTPYTIENSYPQQKRFRLNLPRYNAFELISLESKSGFIDSHCHLDFLLQRQGFEGTFADYQRTYQSTFPKSYQGCITVFCNPFSFIKNCMWEKYLKDDKVWASFGCHPHNAKDYNDDIEKSLYAALEHSKVRALGEIGLDYSNRNNCLKEVQFKVFRRQLKIALSKELPVIIHCREAHVDGMKIIKEILPKNYTIHLHCFTDVWEWALKWLNEFPNLYIGITNVVTFPSAESIHEVAKNIPLDRLLLETDAPYFVPKMSPKGTRWSHPGMAIHVAAQIAALKDISVEKVLQAARKNTKFVYNV
ncbi:putative deoxyribonuclease TATDN2 [Trichonephila clavata]|uniref:Putative deoxyribonuclease TATDN2 n=1 Tax=Trichonephila clavata TaxID=2740835 RepID=A0A8X6LPB5_TRICU|nr:putative deoxyribonuclease TATDN2 [Trichonephila clavata]